MDLDRKGKKVQNNKTRNNVRGWMNGAEWRSGGSRLMGVLF